MRDLGVAQVSGVVYEQTFQILAAGNDSSPLGMQSPLNGTTKFNPSMAIIIIVLISAFLFMGFFSIYVRRCTGSDDNGNNATNQQGGRNGQQGAPGAAGVGAGQGLDKSVVESLPLVGYNLVKDLEGGHGKDLSECAVCLSDFEDDEDLRLLPKCGHVFHPDCIDVWFQSHSTCPLCRTSVAPSDKESGKGDAASGTTLADELHAGHSHSLHRHPSLGPGAVPGDVDEEAATIHGGPPVPPNGSILELLSREGVDRILAASLRRTPSQLDAGLARREAEESTVERSGEMRALNRALSRNSTSFRRASRGVEVNERVGAATDSARYNPAVGPLSPRGDANNNNSLSDKREKKRTKSVGSSHSFNMALRRSSSVGSSGRYIRQIFGQNYTDYFSPDSEQDGLRMDRTKLLGTEHRLPIANPPAPIAVRRERSESELNNLHRIEMPVWDNIDLEEASDRVGITIEASPNSHHKSGELRRWGSSSRGTTSGWYPGAGGRKYFSGEFFQGAATPRRGEALDERTKSERLSFGQSLRRTFSLRRTSSDAKEAVTESPSSQQQQQQTSNSSSWLSQMLQLPSEAATASASAARKFMSGASKNMKGPDVHSTPPSPTTSFPQSLPISDQQQQPQQQQQHQQHRPQP